MVADQLLNQPDGAYAIINGYAHWVLPLNGVMELFSTSDIDEDTGHLAVDFEYIRDNNVYTSFDCSFSTASWLLDYQKEMEKWLASPSYHFLDQDSLDSLATNHYIDEVVDETKAFCQAVKQSIHEFGVMDAIIHSDDKPTSDLAF